MEKLNHTKYAILGLLTTGCHSGYSIKQKIDGSLNYFWKISYGQIYPTLKQLVEANLATVRNVVQEGKPDKKEYYLTTKGEQALQQWLNTPAADLPIEKNEHLLKLFFSRHQSTYVTNTQINDYAEKLRERFDTYESIEQMIRDHSPNQEDAPFWLMTLDYGKRTTKAAIEWCEATKIKIKGE